MVIFPATLPRNLGTFRQICNDIETVIPEEFKTTSREGHMYRHVGTCQGLRRKEDYKERKAEGDLVLKGLYRATIYGLAELLGLDNRFTTNLPETLLVDEATDFVAAYGIMRSLVDDGRALFGGNVPRTAYLASGDGGVLIPYPNIVNGPLLTLSTHHIELQCLVEEATHFLQDFYERDEKPTDPIWHWKWWNPKGDNSRYGKDWKIGEGEKLRSGLVTPHYTFVPPKTAEEILADHVLHEATALFVRSIVHREEQPLLDTSREYVDIFGIGVNLLIERGFDAALASILKNTGTEDLPSFFAQDSRNHLFGKYFGRNIFSDLTHILGYNLGYMLARQVKTIDDVREFVDFLFNPGDAKERLDEITQRVDNSFLSILPTIKAYN